MSDNARGALARAAGALTPAREVGELLDAYRAEILTAEADLIVRHCPNHNPAEQPTAWMDCHCPVADDMRRRATSA